MTSIDADEALPARHVRGRQPLVILGAGGYAREIVDIVDALEPDFELLGFVTGDGTTHTTAASSGLEVIGSDDALADIDAAYVIAIGDGAVRERLDRTATAHGLRPATLVHPAATIGASVRLGNGAVLAAGARLTNNITIGRHSHVNLNATVAHDCVLGDYVTVNPLAAISGACVLEDRVTVGTGAAVIQHRRVGAGSTVGAGAVLLHDVKTGVTALGNPARPLRW